MKPIDFVKGIKTSLLDDSFDSYKETFETIEANDPSVTDAYWKEALKFFGTLDKKQRRTLFDIIRQVQYDTTASLLAALDGVSSIEGIDKDFVLTIKGDKKVLNGDLSDLFLESVEGWYPDSHSAG